VSVAAVEILRLLQKNDLRVFRTTDIRTLAGLTPAASAHSLRRLARRGLLTKLKRGLWLREPSGDVSPEALVPFLAAPWPAYVSLYSALSYYSVVEEVPHIVYGVTSGRPARFNNPLGAFQFHHLPARLMWGYEVLVQAHAPVLMAEPEKAFLDLIYLSLIPRSGLRPPHKRGRAWKLDIQKARVYAKKFRFKPLEKHLDRILSR
jgi:predicted transcriptional regulator of viral defense system